MTFAELIQPIVERRDMSREHAKQLMAHLMSGDATPAQIGGVLIGLRTKGTTTRELAAFAEVLREKAMTIKSEFTDLVDTCGTGGGVPTFNISTAAAIVASAAGARIAKHGNRAVTSTCGSADVLEELAVPILSDPEQLLHLLTSHGLVFLFAPAHHPAMRHVGPTRKELGIRTVFNQLGPLANPAGASRQLIGVYDGGLMRSMGGALKELGAERALLVHGVDGMDEISPCSETEAIRVDAGKVSPERWTPADFGQDPIPQEAVLPGSTREESAKILLEAIGDAKSMRSQAIVPSAAAAIWLGGKANDFLHAAELARAAIASGAAHRKLSALQSYGEEA